MGDPVILEGDCIEVMATLEASSVDSMVCDPPYGISFMGKEWDKPGQATRSAVTSAEKAENPYGRSRAEIADYSGSGDAVSARQFQAWCEDWATQAYRVLKPGGHILAFGGTRTYHRLVSGIEDAGFEIRDSIHWLYGSGFPKSMDVAKAIDRPDSVPILKEADDGIIYGSGLGERFVDRDAPRELSDKAQEWDGWGTALKPAHEPIVVARKPLIGTVVANVLEHGTGALNIDGARIGTADSLNGVTYSEGGRKSLPGDERVGAASGMFVEGGGRVPGGFDQPIGRWPANLILSHHEDCGDQCLPGCPVADIDEQSGASVSRIGQPRSGVNGEGWGMTATGAEYDDTGGASRFFYQAKSSAEDRNYGLRRGQRNPHPTVKPIALMRYLCRLVTPPGGTVLDPFMGSGSCGIAAVQEGFEYVGIEKTPDYIPLATQRIAYAIEFLAEPQSLFG